MNAQLLGAEERTEELDERRLEGHLEVRLYCRGASSANDPGEEGGDPVRTVNLWTPRTGPSPPRG
jgi:hypothetical protein